MAVGANFLKGARLLAQASGRGGQLPTASGKSCQRSPSSLSSFSSLSQGDESGLKPYSAPTKQGAHRVRAPARKNLRKPKKSTDP